MWPHFGCPCTLKDIFPLRKGCKTKPTWIYSQDKKSIFYEPNKTLHHNQQLIHGILLANIQAVGCGDLGLE